jgi:hypothetical protein
MGDAGWSFQAKAATQLYRLTRIAKTWCLIICVSGTPTFRRSGYFRGRAWKIYMMRSPASMTSTRRDAMRLRSPGPPWKERARRLVPCKSCVCRANVTEQENFNGTGHQQLPFSVR